MGQPPGAGALLPGGKVFPWVWGLTAYVWSHELLSAEESGVQPVTFLPPAQRMLTAGRVYVSVCEWPGSQHPGRYRPVSYCAPCPLQPRGTGHTLSPMVRAAGLPSRPRFLRTVWPLTAVTQIPWVAGLQGGVHAGGRAGGAPWISPTLQACLPTGDCYTGGQPLVGVPSPRDSGLLDPGPRGPWLDPGREQATHHGGCNRRVWLLGRRSQHSGLRPVNHRHFNFIFIFMFWPHYAA